MSAVVVCGGAFRGASTNVLWMRHDSNSTEAKFRTSLAARWRCDQNLVADNVLRVIMLLPEAPNQESFLGMHSTTIFAPISCITKLRMPFTDARISPNSDCRLSIADFRSRACGPTSWTSEQAACGPTSWTTDQTDEGLDASPLTLQSSTVVM